MTQTAITKKYLPDWAQPEVHGRATLFTVTEAQLKEVCGTLNQVHKLSLKIVLASDERTNDDSYHILYVFGIPKIDHFIIPRLKIAKEGNEFPSLSTIVHGASLYEGRIKEMFGLTPIGHPSGAQPTLLHENWPVSAHPLRKDFSVTPTLHNNEKHMEYHFTEVGGEGIYEVPVGPVHAGIIEPGHFRFSMAGERIIKLEAKLGWMHKGTEKLFEKLPLNEQVRLSEHVAGDTAFAHSTAFCQAVETLAHIDVSSNVRYGRVIWGEMERLAGHLSDIGFILSDTGFNFGGAQCARLRERIMRMNEQFTGHRFLRGVNMVGGSTKTISPQEKGGFAKELLLLQKDFLEVMAVADESSTVFNRLEGTGVLAHAVAKDHGAVGVPGRASGVTVDVRADHPYAGYGDLGVTPAVENSGDVLARFTVRKREVLSSIELIHKALLKLTDETIAPTGPITLDKNSYAIGLAEGWRGEIIYVITTDNDGKIKRVALRDPSFINWHLIPYAAPGNVLLDFPLINKSFNLSYTGNDL